MFANRPRYSADLPHPGCALRQQALHHQGGAKRLGGSPASIPRAPARHSPSSTPPTTTPATRFRATNPASPVMHKLFKSIPAGASNTWQPLYPLTGANTLPLDVPFGNPALMGISDLGGPGGVYPSTMTGRNIFRGPGAYNLDASVSKQFPHPRASQLRASRRGLRRHQPPQPLHPGKPAGRRQLFGRQPTDHCLQRRHWQQRRSQRRAPLSPVRRQNQLLTRSPRLPHEELVPSW